MMRRCLILSFCLITNVLVSSTFSFVRADEPEPKEVGARKSAKTDPDKEESKSSTKRGDTKQKVDMSAVPPDKKVEKKALADLGEGFKLKRTLHYSVFYDTSEEDLEAFSLAIEKTYRSAINYTIKLGIPVEQPKKKMPIYYFNEHKRYSDYSKKVGAGEQSQNTAGVFLPSLNFSMFYNLRDMAGLKDHLNSVEKQIEGLNEQLRSRGLSAAQKQEIRRHIAALRKNANVNKDRGGSGSESTVQHEVSHQVLWNIGFHNPKAFITNPRWLAEGTAQMFETVASGGSSNVGAVNKERLDSYREYEKEGKLFPLRDFIATPKYFHTEEIHIAYPESWALAHYLNRAKRKQLAEYIEIINKRSKNYKSTPEQELKDFEKAFGELNDKWEKRWKLWMKKVN